MVSSAPAGQAATAAATAIAAWFIPLLLLLLLHTGGGGEAVGVLFLGSGAAARPRKMCFGRKEARLGAGPGGGWERSKKIKSGINAFLASAKKSVREREGGVGKRPRPGLPSPPQNHPSPVPGSRGMCARRK